MKEETQANEGGEHENSLAPDPYARIIDPGRRDLQASLASQPLDGNTGPALRNWSTKRRKKKKKQQKTDEEVDAELAKMAGEI